MMAKRGLTGRRMAAASASVVAFLLLITFGFYRKQVDRKFPQSYPARKLLQIDEGSSSAAAAISTNRLGDRCTVDDLEVHQDVMPPLPNGIPTFAVTVLNSCPLLDGCAMGQIHLSCGQFSSARNINPRIFRRLQVDDCLLNDGRPLRPSESISFQYSDSKAYDLAIRSAACTS